MKIVATAILLLAFLAAPVFAQCPGGVCPTTYTPSVSTSPLVQSYSYSYGYSVPQYQYTYPSTLNSGVIYSTPVVPTYQYQPAYEGMIFLNSGSCPTCP